MGGLGLPAVLKVKHCEDECHSAKRKGSKLRRSPFEIVVKNAFAMGVDVQVQFYRVPYICAKFALEIRLHVVESREHNNEGPARDTLAGRHSALGQVGDTHPSASP